MNNNQIIVSKLFSNIFVNILDYFVPQDNISSGLLPTQNNNFEESPNMIFFIIFLKLVASILMTYPNGVFFEEKIKNIDCPIDQVGQSCSICIEKFTNNKKVCLTICNHYFCSECLEEWIKHTKNCPLCRTNL